MRPKKCMLPYSVCVPKKSVPKKVICVPKAVNVSNFYEYFKLMALSIVN